jgi:hypothetical protein
LTIASTPPIATIASDFQMTKGQSGDCSERLVLIVVSSAKSFDFGHLDRTPEFAQSPCRDFFVTSEQRAKQPPTA